jgi:YggT family protein
MLIIAIAQLLIASIRCVEYLLIVYIIIGWFVAFGALKNRESFFFKIYVFLIAKIEPILGIIRRVVPPIMGLDFSALIVFFILHIITRLVVNLANIALRLF